jgi:hypothetical protein
VQVTGKVTRDAAGDEHLSGRSSSRLPSANPAFRLPDSLVLPTEAGPCWLRDAAFGQLAFRRRDGARRAAPRRTRFSRPVVIDRAIDLAEAGFRDTLHEPLADNAAQVLFDFAGSTYQRLPERITRPDDLDFAQRNARGFDELRRRSRRGDHLADVIGSLLARRYDARCSGARSRRRPVRRTCRCNRQRRPRARFALRTRHSSTPRRRYGQGREDDSSTWCPSMPA